MTQVELLRRVMRGELLIVGEFRGARAEVAAYVDKRTGDAISEIRATYLIECACRGDLDRSLIHRKLGGFKNAEDVLLPQEKGKPYVFFLDSFKWERGGLSGWMPDREPEPLETITEAGCAPSGALPSP